MRDQIVHLHMILKNLDILMIYIRHLYVLSLRKVIVVGENFADMHMERWNWEKNLKMVIKIIINNNKENNHISNYLIIIIISISSNIDQWYINIHRWLINNLLCHNRWWIILKNYLILFLINNLILYLLFQYNNIIFMDNNLHYQYNNIIYLDNNRLYQYNNIICMDNNLLYLYSLLLYPYNNNMNHNFLINNHIQCNTHQKYLPKFHNHNKHPKQTNRLQ